MEMKTLNGDPIAWEDTKFLMLLANQNSGTTALVQYLHTQMDPHVPSYMPNVGCREGQFLPSVRDHMRGRNPWSPKKHIDFKFVREKWEEAAEGRMFIDCSQPNMIRFDAVKNVFGDDSVGIISICNPYHYSSSCMRRYDCRFRNPEKTVSCWVKRAQSLRKIAEEHEHIPILTYERFTGDPKSVSALLGVPYVESKPIKGKPRSQLRGVKSGYAMAMGFLTEQEIIAMSKELTKRKNLMNFFGYDIRGPSILIEAQNADPESFAIGKARRAEKDNE